LRHTKTTEYINSGGFKVGGGQGKTKKGGPMMTTTYSANHDKHF